MLKQITIVAVLFAASCGLTERTNQVSQAQPAQIAPGDCQFYFDDGKGPIPLGLELENDDIDWLNANGKLSCSGECSAEKCRCLEIPTSKGAMCTCLSITDGELMHQSFPLTEGQLMHFLLRFGC